MNTSNSKTWGTWAIRKIRKGRVKFHGHWYYAGKTYDGSLDGAWIVFYSYTIWDDDGKNRYFYPYVCPWGTLEFFNMKTEEEIDNYDGFNSPLVDEEGAERWSLWYPKRADIISIINRVDDRQLKRHLTIQAMSVLLPDIDWRDRYRAVDAHFYDQPIIEGLQS